MAVSCKHTLMNASWDQVAYGLAIRNPPPNGAGADVSAAWVGLQIPRRDRHPARAEQQRACDVKRLEQLLRQTVVTPRADAAEEEVGAPLERVAPHVAADDDALDPLPQPGFVRDGGLEQRGALLSRDCVCLARVVRDHRVDARVRRRQPTQQRHVACVRRVERGCEDRRERTRQRRVRIGYKRALGCQPEEKAQDEHRRADRKGRWDVQHHRNKNHDAVDGNGQARQHAQLK
eukprot:6193305-Pleurochrysis_carterae.AAC.3